jgi:hypothetical protein
LTEPLSGQQGEFAKSVHELPRLLRRQPLLYRPVGIGVVFSKSLPEHLVGDASLLHCLSGSRLHRGRIFRDAVTEYTACTSTPDTRLDSTEVLFQKADVTGTRVNNPVQVHPFSARGFYANGQALRQKTFLIELC